MVTGSLHLVGARLAYLIGDGRPLWGERDQLVAAVGLVFAALDEATMDLLVDGLAGCPQGRVELGTQL